jgi:hypothetical protein
MLYSWHFSLKHKLRSFIGSYLHQTCFYEISFPVRRFVNIIYIYKYATHFVNVDIKLLNIETKETNNGHFGDLVEHSGILFRKVAYSSCNALNV